ncbi:MAG: kinase [Selenomonadaceae bacterium]|nr:kinase [Selenomonadaceae bacterium]
MLIVKTPFRISFLGGGTDMEDYYKEYGGAVLATTFDKYCYHIMRYYPPFFDHKGQLTYSQIEQFNVPEDIDHPAVREALRKYDMLDVQITYDADLPARSGLGTSSAFAVGLLNGLHSLRGEFVDKMDLALEAIHLERELCREAGGVQDQLECSFGGLNRMSFHSDGFDVSPVIMPNRRKREFSDHLLLFFTGFVRFSSEIADEQIGNIRKKLEQLHEMVGLVDEGVNILTGMGELTEFGRLLDYAWSLKRSLASQISNDDLDALYERAKKAGAIGGKILGAGGGGFMLLFVEPDKKQQVIEAMKGLLHVPFSLERGGTKVIYYKSEERMER